MCKQKKSFSKKNIVNVFRKICFFIIATGNKNKILLKRDNENKETTTKRALRNFTFIKINQKEKGQQKSYKIVKEFLPKMNNKR